MNLTYLISGIGFAWSSPVLVKLPLTATQGSTVASMLPLGMILGPFLSGALLDRIGRKGTVGVNMALMTVANLILTFTNDMKILCTGRILIGINCGVVFSCVPLFIAEISEVSFFLLTSQELSGVMFYILFQQLHLGLHLSFSHTSMFFPAEDYCERAIRSSFLAIYYAR